ncbi:MAG: hypothetical protein AVDCRST_MAG78-3461 [uncultured Rubrobacteraceae bacterium]|uniref:Uncharacterized protein n=1 Tax=uncultured Rubrobacteraceae bacterium TaxID=349277 RepID=A0A6J4QYF5_9ACTN|nr:MAG: hypothetical protein AVDCRST_MAG78-3461 [uncultured Rubrobacteraceae bacterium]
MYVDPAIRADFLRERDLLPSPSRSNCAAYALISLGYGSVILLGGPNHPFGGWYAGDPNVNI